MGATTWRLARERAAAALPTPETILATGGGTTDQAGGGAPVSMEAPIAVGTVLPALPPRRKPRPSRG